MTTTATFVQAIDDIDVAIKKFVGAFVPFTNKTAIVDNETLKKAVEHTELEQVLLNNYWLFFLMYAATNMRVVNAYLSTLIPKGKGRGAKDGA
jgi:hypothetical protein